MFHLLVVFILMNLSACSSVPKNEHQIQQLVPSHLWVRRPQGRGANPKASPGGVDYRSEIPPSQRMDCEKVSWLFRDLDLKSIQQCLHQLQKPMEVTYRLRREVAPEFILNAQEELDSCLKSVLPRLPVPREIIFQAPRNDGSGYDCYSSRLDIEADKWMGVRLPVNRLLLKITFPLKYLPINEDETQRLLGSWVLSPFQDPIKKAWLAKEMSDSHCRQCMGGEGLMRNQDPSPYLWP